MGDAARSTPTSTRSRPRMLIFRMPVDCFAPASMIVHAGQRLVERAVRPCAIPEAARTSPRARRATTATSAASTSAATGNGACVARPARSVRGAVPDGRVRSEDRVHRGRQRSDLQRRQPVHRRSVPRRRRPAATCSSADGTACPAADRVPRRRRCARRARATAARRCRASDGDFCTDDVCDPARRLPVPSGDGGARTQQLSVWTRCARCWRRCRDELGGIVAPAPAPARPRRQGAGASRVDAARSTRCARALRRRRACELRAFVATGRRKSTPRRGCARATSSPTPRRPRSPWRAGSADRAVTSVQWPCGRRRALAGHHLRHARGEERARVVDGRRARLGLAWRRRPRGTPGGRRSRCRPRSAPDRRAGSTRPRSRSARAARRRSPTTSTSCAAACLCDGGRPLKRCAAGLDSARALDYERPVPVAAPSSSARRSSRSIPRGAASSGSRCSTCSGLRELGHDAWWLEVLWTRGDAARDRAVHRRASGAGATRSASRIAWCCSTSPTAARDEPPGRVEYHGHDRGRRSRARRRDALCSTWPTASPPPLRAGFARTALFDIDPGTFQLWAREWDMGVGSHDAYLTIGMNLGAPDSPIPLDGVRVGARLADRPSRRRGRCSRRRRRARATPRSRSGGTTTTPSSTATPTTATSARASCRSLPLPGARRRASSRSPPTCMPTRPRTARCWRGTAGGWSIPRRSRGQRRGVPALRAGVARRGERRRSRRT